MVDRKRGLLKIPPFRELCKITINQNEWSSKTPYQKWAYLYGLGRVFLFPTGVPPFQDDQTVPGYAHIATVYVALYFFLVFYTAYYHITRGEFGQFLPCTCVAGQMISTFAAFLIGISHLRYKLHSLIEFGGRYIYPDNHDKTKFNKICSDHIDSSIKRLYSRLMIISFVFVLLFGGMAFEYFHHGVKSTLTELAFPFVERKSNSEFILNLIFQGLVFSNGMFGLAGTEVVMTLFDDVVTISPKLAKYKLKILIDKIERKRITKPQILFMLKDIVQHAIDTDNYQIDVRDTVKARSFVTPPSFTYLMGMCIFCQFTMNYGCGYGWAGLTFVQLFYYCELGERFQDNGFDEVLNESDWHHLPLKYQKCILLLIHRKQNGIKLTVGPFAVINRELFKRVTNSVASFVMFLYRFSARP